jgi:hypothetical protein
MSRASRREFVGYLASTTALAATTVVLGDEPQPRDGLKEPVLRVSKRLEPAAPPQHPMDPAIQVARDGLERLQKSMQDYSCLLVKQERIKGELMPTEHIHAEIRNERMVNGIKTPFSVYLRFLKPEEMSGRQVIYVKGANNGKIVGQEFKGIRALAGAVWLRPDGLLAMQGQRYPITDIGIENLVVKLIERAIQDKKNDPQGKFTTVRFIKGAKINGRQCTVLEAKHPEKKPWFDFYLARVFIDDELQVPVRYAAYSWATVPGGKPVLEEAYTHLNIKPNVGLKDEDFDYKTKFRKQA